MGFMKMLLIIVHHILALRTLLCNFTSKCMISFGLRYGKQTPCRMRSDSKNLEKLPIHIGFVIVEEELSYIDIANMIVWSIAMGVTYISLYDRTGVFKRNKTRLRSTVDSQTHSILGNEKNKYDINFHTSRVKERREGGCSRSVRVDVTLTSLEDGRQSIADAARNICRAVSSHQFICSDITPTNVDALLQDERGCPDPDLIVKFGRTESLMGFQPWQIRLTEILTLPTHHSIDYKSFHRVLQSYGNTEQRFGK